VKQELEAVTDTMHFLPYPGNFGFILRPGAIEKSLKRTDHISCLILTSAISEKEVVEVYSIGVLTLEKDGIEEHIIICIPVEKEQQTMQIKDFVDFMTKYEAVRFQIQHWFLNYKGPNMVRIKGWEDEEFAGHLIDEQESN
jgi:inorganic pyrophosphatase